MLRVCSSMVLLTLLTTGCAIVENYTIGSPRWEARQRALAVGAHCRELYKQSGLQAYMTCQREAGFPVEDDPINPPVFIGGHWMWF